MALNPNQGAMQGLGMWPGLQYANQAASPAMQYQSQVPDARMPAMEQTWGPWLDRLNAAAPGGIKVGRGELGGGKQLTGESMQTSQHPQYQQGQPVAQMPTTTTPQAAMTGLQAAAPKRPKTAADSYYQQKYPGTV